MPVHIFLGSTFYLKMTFNFQYSKSSFNRTLQFFCFFVFLFIFNDFSPRNEKTHTNSFYGTIQIFGCLINTLSKYIFTQRSTKL